MYILFKFRNSLFYANNATKWMSRRKGLKIQQRYYQKNYIILTIYTFERNCYMDSFKRFSYGWKYSASTRINRCYLVLASVYLWVKRSRGKKLFLMTTSLLRNFNILMADGVWMPDPTETNNSVGQFWLKFVSRLLTRVCFFDFRRILMNKVS